MNKVETKCYCSVKERQKGVKSRFSGTSVQNSWSKIIFFYMKQIFLKKLLTSKSNCDNIVRQIRRDTEVVITERSWKPSYVLRTVGSNPTLSAIFLFIALFTKAPMEKYSSWWRGAPAKGVGRVTGARVQISPTPPKNSSNLFRGIFYFLPITSSLFPQKFS